ncbi:hypothetical protein FD08_GL002954 [Lentilactobacillus parakefiri DSM 10551]|nr:hypothetical protein FD08_GL002954 [Lentilactobacillus parakefiri DSM 10551]
MPIPEYITKPRDETSLDPEFPTTAVIKKARKLCRTPFTTHLDVRLSIKCFYNK